MNLLKTAFDSFKADGHPMVVHNIVSGAIVPTEDPQLDYHRIAYRLPDVPNGLVFIDVDTKHGADGHKALEHLSMGTPFQTTNTYNGKVACHYVFRYEGPPGPVHPFGRAAGVEFFTSARSMYLSPSRCKTESDNPHEYYNDGDWKDLAEAITNAPPLPKDIADAWLTKKRKPEVSRIKTSRPLAFGCNAYAAKALEELLVAIRTAPDGTKDNTANACIYRAGLLIGHGAIDRVAASDSIRSACLESGYNETKTEDKLNRCIDDGIRDSVSEIWEFNACVRSEDETSAREHHMPVSPELSAFARAFLEHEKGGVFSLSDKSWLMWDGRRFAPRSKEEIECEIRSYFIHVREHCASVVMSKEAAKKILRTAEMAPFSSSWGRMTQEVRTQCRASLSDFDNHPELLNFGNGTYNLATGEFGPHLKEHRLTKMAAVNYVKGGRANKWNELVSFLSGGDTAKATWILSMLADGLYGDNAHQKMLIIHGRGANGKSVLIKVLQKTLGDYMAVLPSRELGENKMGESATSPALVKAHKARLATVVELKQGFVFNEGIIKNLTASDGFSARTLYSDDQVNVTFGMMVIACNELPKSDEGGFAMKRRLAIVEAPDAVPEAQRIAMLDENIFKEEGGEVLSSLAELCTAQARRVRNEPAEVRQAAEQYSSSDEYRKVFDTYFEVTGDRSDRMNVAYVHGSLVIDAYVNDKEQPKGYMKTRFRKFIMIEHKGVGKATVDGVDQLTGIVFKGNHYEMAQRSLPSTLLCRSATFKPLN